MTEPKVLLGKAPSSAAEADRLQGWVWPSLAAAGWLFVVVGLTDLALAWYPTQFGSPNWEFGTITVTLNGLPVPALGLTLILCAALAEGHRKATRAVLVVLVLLAVVLLMLGVLYATNAPIGLRTITDPVAHSGLKKAIVKSVVQLLAYPAASFYLAFRLWKRTRRTA